jgi:hypothetical protein
MSSPQAMNTPLRDNTAGNHSSGVTATTPHSTSHTALAVNPLTAFTSAKANLPSKDLLKTLYDLALKDTNSDQYGLTEAAPPAQTPVLSLEDVFLPAAVYQVQQSLKHVQSKVQRDGTPAQVQMIVMARKHLLDQVRRSIQVLPVQRRQRQEQQASSVRVAQERQQAAHQVAARQQLQADRKNHPYNQELWREVALLMTEQEKLMREERLWDEALARLPKAPDASAMQVEPATAAFPAHTPMTTELGTTLQMLEDLQLWTTRVRTSLAQIRPALEQAEVTRTDLFQEHQSSRFKGYPGIQQPKDLLRILSQDTE